MTAKDFLDLKEYLKQTLKLEWRENIQGDSFLVITLEDEIISMVPMEFIEENEEE